MNQYIKDFLEYIDNYENICEKLHTKIDENVTISA